MIIRKSAGDSRRSQPPGRSWPTASTRSRGGRAGRHDGRARRARRGIHPPARACRRSRATGASRRRSARRPTTRSSTASPAVPPGRGRPLSSTSASPSTATWPTRPSRSAWARSSRRRSGFIDVTAGRSRPASRSAGRAGGSATSRTRCRRSSRPPGFSVVRSLVGHGVGREMHEDPQIPNYGDPGRVRGWRRAWCSPSSRWSTPAAYDVVLADDGWTIHTADGSLSAHFEHTVAVGKKGPRVLTRRRSERSGAGA